VSFLAALDSQAEGNFVDHIRDVVGQVARRLTNSVQEVSEEVSQGIDGPTDGDDESHSVVSGLDVTVGLVSMDSDLGGLTKEDLEEDLSLII